MKYSQILLGIIICIVVEFFVYNLNHKYHLFGPFFSTTLPPISASISNFSEKRLGTGKLTNPLLECVNNEDDGPTNSLNISKVELNQVIDGILNSKKVSFLSVYVRDLNNGPWLDVNTDEKFIGGSLLKVPILITYFKMAEDNPSLMNKVILYKQREIPSTEYFKSTNEIKVGNKYTVSQLLEYMTYYSDNNAMQLLVENMNMDALNDTFEGLGFGKPDIHTPLPVDTKTYASFFRVLFNSSYLNRSDSEKVLQMLTKTDFDKGLTEQLPKEITIAHKFGERTDGYINQLHDCGIVYYPKHPYLLCIMSKGGAYDDLSKAISKISKFIYDQVKQVDQ